MAYVVRANIGSTGNRRRITSRKFRTRKMAQDYADVTNEDRPGANARVVSI